MGQRVLKPQFATQAVPRPQREPKQLALKPHRLAPQLKPKQLLPQNTRFKLQPPKQTLALQPPPRQELTNAPQPPKQALLTKPQLPRQLLAKRPQLKPAQTEFVLPRVLETWTQLPSGEAARVACWTGADAASARWEFVGDAFAKKSDSAATAARKSPRLAFRNI